MLSIAWSTLRLRLVAFLGTFAALALGTALMAAMGQVLATTVGSPDRPPQRYAAAPYVIAPDRDLHVATWRGTESAPLAERRGLDPALVARFPGAVVDRVFPAQLSGGPDAVGRPWSASRTAPQRLVAGRAPKDAGEIAVSAGAAVAGPGVGEAAGQEAGRVGGRVKVFTRQGVATYTVVGLTDGPPTVFFTDAQAARLSPRVDALALWSRPGGVEALTGQDRALLDPNREADARARDNANTIVGIAAGFAVFIAVFVVSSTFAFAVAQRRREFALLRTVGATPRQVRRMVYGEAGLVALAASAVGAVAGPYAAGPILDWLVGLGMAPSWLVPGTQRWPAVVAFSVGVVVALCGVAGAARRAGRVHPAEAMRESAVETRAMPRTRLVAGVALLGYALVAMVVTAVNDPAGASGNKSFMPVVMVLVAAAGLLAPAVVRPLARMPAVPLGRLRGAGATIVPAGAAASARQTAATAAPVLVAVGLAASLLGAAAMTDAAKTAMRTAPVRADYLVLARGAGGLDDQLVDRLRRIPGVEVATFAPTSVYTLEGATSLVRRPTEAVDPATLGDVLQVPVTAGSIAALDDRSIAVSETWERRLGEAVKLWRADGSQVTLKVVALLGVKAAADSYVTPAHGLSAPVTTAYVKIRPGTAPGEAGAALRQAGAALRQAVEGHNARVLTTAAWAAETGDRQGSASRLGLLVVLGIVLAYTAIALVNILLMAASDRAAERATLRLLGATRARVAGYAAAEALLVVAIGVVLAAGVVAISLAGLWSSLVQIAGPVAVSVPWPQTGGVVLGCAVLAVAAAVVPSLRRA